MGHKHGTRFGVILDTKGIEGPWHSETKHKPGGQPRCPAHRRDFGYDAIWRSGLESTPKPWSCHLNVGWMLGSKTGRMERRGIPHPVQGAPGYGEPLVGNYSGVCSGKTVAVPWRNGHSFGQRPSCLSR